MLKSSVELKEIAVGDNCPWVCQYELHVSQYTPWFDPFLI